MTLNYILLFGLLIIAFYTDLRKKIIPNWLTISGAIIGLIYHLIIHGLDGLKDSTLSMVIGFSLFLLLYLFGSVGAGDVKLFAAIGALTNIEFVLQASMYSILYAGLIGLIIILARREFVKRINNILSYLLNLFLTKKIRELKESQKPSSYHFPFMYGVLPGVLTTFYYTLLY